MLEAERERERERERGTLNCKQSFLLESISIKESLTVVRCDVLVRNEIKYEPTIKLGLPPYLLSVKG
jgi:hypothetical protein